MIVFVFIDMGNWNNSFLNVKKYQNQYFLIHSNTFFLSLISKLHLIYLFFLNFFKKLLPIIPLCPVIAMFYLSYLYNKKL